MCGHSIFSYRNRYVETPLWVVYINVFCLHLPNCFSYLIFLSSQYLFLASLHNTILRLLGSPLYHTYAHAITVLQSHIWCNWVYNINNIREIFLFGPDQNLPFFLGLEINFFIYLALLELLITDLALSSSFASNTIKCYVKWPIYPEILWEPKGKQTSYQHNFAANTHTSPRNPYIDGGRIYQRACRMFRRTMCRAEPRRGDCLMGPA